MDLTAHIQIWMSCPKFTVQVDIGPDGKIIKAAPIVHRFIGQPIGNLRRWMRCMSPMEYREARL